MRKYANVKIIIFEASVSGFNICKKRQHDLCEILGAETASTD